MSTLPRFQTGMTSFTMYHIAIVVVKALGSGRSKLQCSYSYRI
ncbi:hypothetical protein [Wolbachia endosymbiont (group A) of Cheilosia soror]|nr:hypothetical protein [Wolbachia endosymbiont (group A) of Cheilosia soror]